MIYAVLQCNKNLYLFLEKSWSYEVGKVCLFEEYVLLLFCNFSTKPWQFLLVSFVKGHLSPQVHEWCVKALLPCEQTCERRFCPHGTCQGGQVLTQSLTLKSAQLKSQHSPATHGMEGAFRLRRTILRYSQLKQAFMIKDRTRLRVKVFSLFTQDWKYLLQFRMTLNNL